MVGYFITRIIILLVGYAHPAYGCYKSVEKKKPEIEELRYWCKYWILVGLFTFLERIGDIFVSWLPLYCEIKIALFVYLWYPKSQGISYVYETLLCPYMSKHELDIDQGISTLKIRGHSIIVQLLQCGYLRIHQIFSYLQQRFAIYKINNRAKSKDRQEQELLLCFSVSCCRMHSYSGHNLNNRGFKPESESPEPNRSYTLLQLLGFRFEHRQFTKANSKMEV